MPALQASNFWLKVCLKQELARQNMTVAAAAGGKLSCEPRLRCNAGECGAWVVATKMSTGKSHQAAVTRACRCSRTSSGELALWGDKLV